MNLRNTLIIIVILLVSLTGFAQKKVKKCEKSYLKTQKSMLTKTKKGIKECEKNENGKQIRKQAKTTEQFNSNINIQNQACRKKKCKKKKAKSFWVYEL